VGVVAEDGVPLFETGEVMAQVSASWPKYRKVSFVRAIKMDQPFRVKTINGEVVSGEAGDFLCVADDGDCWPHHNQDGEFEAKYEEIKPVHLPGHGPGVR
jgi:hypothetical protein